MLLLASKPRSASAPATPLTVLGSNCKLWLDRAASTVTYSSGTSVQQINDLSGLSHHAVNAFGTTTQPTQASAGAVVDFDGSNDYLDVADHSDLDFTTAMVLGFKITPDVVTGNKCPLSKAPTTGGSWSFQTNGAAMRWHFGSAGSNFGEGGTMTAGVAAYFLAIFDGSGGSNATRAILRLNGSPLTLSFTGTIPSSIATGSDVLRLGSFAGGAQFFDGKFNAVFAGNVVPSAGQITALESYLAAA